MEESRLHALQEPPIVLYKLYITSRVPRQPCHLTVKAHELAILQLSDNEQLLEKVADLASRSIASHQKPLPLPVDGAIQAFSHATLRLVYGTPV